MAKYSCFNCPEKTHDDKRERHHKCPTCGFTYGFPLDDFPNSIDSYKVIKPLSRGFYGAAYVASHDVLGDCVVKIIPESIYKEHGKDFSKECREHAELAKGSLHIVGINNLGNANVDFKNGLTIPCHYQVLAYLPGKLLREVLEQEEKISSTRITQIAIDLFRILDVLRQKKKNHNDLHAENIIVQELPHSERRADEVDNHIRVVAIDIGSLTSDNRAGDSPDRKGDAHWVAEYLIKLGEKLIKDPDEVSDQDFRLATLLEDRAKLLFPASEYLRAPNFNEVIESLKNCYHQQVYPWEEPLRLLNFNDTYNAQTLEPWYVPSLIVDPNDQWLNKISGKGPLVITGMRGCGKTMMLRALQFHARAAASKITSNGQSDEQIRLLNHETFVGIYVSCNKLLDEPGKSPNDPTHQPFSKLFIRYGVEAIKALRHLQTIDASKVKGEFYSHIIDVYKGHLKNHKYLDEIQSDVKLEQSLLNMIYSLNRGENDFVINVHPANAFPALAQAIRDCSSMWANSYILFLLDDVSTRYLGEGNIKTLLSSLIFQSEECAFKITSEVQSIKFGLYSPGKIEQAKKGRDFETFDLGGAVNSKIRNRGGKKFVIEILNRRAAGNKHKHPKKLPLQLIGDSTLKSIAQNIVGRGQDKTLRKKIYHGLSALAGVCVGDIGDIINLYDLIIRNYDAGKKKTPIPAAMQNECFQELCSIRLHEVNTRGSDYKDFALSFAEASHELLMNSSKNGDSRLRQYYSIYVRITTGDHEWQYRMVRELLDAGIFVYSGGSSIPRTLGNDNNPINQFKLTYRKLYGVSKLIGLWQGDRFELTGEQVERWLKNPSDGKQILMENLGGPSSTIDEEDEEFDEEFTEEIIKEADRVVQAELFSEDKETPEESNYNEGDLKELISQKTPESCDVSFEDLKTIEFDYLIAGLGFEERTLHSIKELLNLKPKKIILIQYDEVGKSKEILTAIKASGIPYEILSYEKVKTAFNTDKGKILCDVTGMSKSLIFNAVRNVLKTNHKIWISHQQAEKYYPLHEEINEALTKMETEKDNFTKLDVITNNLIKGETGPYETYDLLLSDTDESKRSILIGFSNSKYERLFQVLDQRTCDKVQIVSPDPEANMRGKLAHLASEVVFKSTPNTELFIYDPNDLDGILNFLTTQYQLHYVDQNYNFELAITGSKRHTIACAAISSIFKVSRCWYVKPANWNTEKFSKGIGKKSYFRIDI